MLPEERALRDVTCGKRDPASGNRYYPVFPPMRISRLITAFRRAVIEDICQQVSDAINQFPKKTQVKLMDAIMRYEKPKAIRGEGRK